MAHRGTGLVAAFVASLQPEDLFASELQLLGLQELEDQGEEDHAEVGEDWEVARGER